MNPLVVAALRRIERAHSQPGGNVAAATALAYKEQPTLDLNISPTPSAVDERVSDEVVTKPERVHNLAVVPTPEVTAFEAPPETAPEPRKPRRLIDDRNDPCLNYLDSISTSVLVESREYDSAPLFRRLLSAVTDLLVVGFFRRHFWR